uniref:Uncharacterized protein n=1 Tax=Caenorhabditis tropicalis TaxID=1561998 RepID=A0A1I7UF23_9PELO
MGEEVVLEAAAVPPILAAVQGAPNGEEENDLIIDVVQMGEPVDMPRPQMNLNQNGEEDDSDVEVIEEEED